jgi:hypothetical protein
MTRLRCARMPQSSRPTLAGESLEMQNWCADRRSGIIGATVFL